MTQILKINGDRLEVATEEELLAFANSIRQAGGANVLEALLPSTPSDSSECLIANALNFGCQVGTASGFGVVKHDSAEARFPSRAERWIMQLPENLTDEQRVALDGVEGVVLHEVTVFPNEPHYKEHFYYLALPESIGNAAAAFDAEVAFDNLNVWLIDEAKREAKEI